MGNLKTFRLCKDVKCLVGNSFKKESDGEIRDFEG